MAFAIRNLSVLAYANGFTLWHYNAGKDELGTISEASYFAPANEMLAAGDLIMLSTTEGARIMSIGIGPNETRRLLPLT